MFRLFGAPVTVTSRIPTATGTTKAVLADFPNRPKKQPTVAEQAEARLALGRLAAERGGYSGIGNSLLSDLSRDCY